MPSKWSQEHPASLTVANGRSAGEFQNSTAKMRNYIFLQFYHQFFLTAFPSHGKLILPAFFHSATNSIPTKTVPGFYSHASVVLLCTADWLLVQHSSFMSGLSWAHQASRGIPHWTLQFKKHAAYFPGSTFHAKVSQFFLSHLYSHENQKLYQSHGISQFEIITKGNKIKCEDHSGYLCVILLENPFSAFCYVSSWLPPFDIADRWHIKYIHTLFFTVTPIFVLPEGNGGRLGGLYWTH